MPKLVNYAVRFDFLRQAAFEVVLRDGGGGLAALSRRSIAAALGTSVNTVRRLLSEEAELATLAAAHVDQRRRHGRWARVRDVAPEQAALAVLRMCMADSEDRVAEELVWLRLLLASASPPVDRDQDGLLLHERFGLSEHGHLDHEAPPGAPAAHPGPSALAAVLRDREDAVAATVTNVLDLLDTPLAERPHRERLVGALLSGLTLRVCPGDLSPEDAVAVLARTIGGWCPG